MMGVTDDQRQQAEWRLLNAKIKQTERQASWEIPKAVAGLAAAAAIFMGFVLAASTWLHPTPQTINVHMDQPLQVQLLGAKP
jgi:hypothetical protein